MGKATSETEIRAEAKVIIDAAKSYFDNNKQARIVDIAIWTGGVAKISRGKVEQDIERLIKQSLEHQHSITESQIPKDI